MEFEPIPEPPKAVSRVKTPVKSTPAKQKPVSPASPTANTPVKPVAPTTVFQSGSTVNLEKLPVGSILELGNVYFKANAYQLDSLSNQTLEALVKLLQANPRLQIEIGGHTNLRPDAGFANQLSENRARTVATYLTDRGIAALRIQYKGYGKTTPKIPGTSAEANRQNQRVEVKILAK